MVSILGKQDTIQNTRIFTSSPSYVWDLVRVGMVWRESMRKTGGQYELLRVRGTASLRLRAVRQSRERTSKGAGGQEFRHDLGGGGVCWLMCACRVSL